jgi:hypothetical protein
MPAAPWGEGRHPRQVPATSEHAGIDVGCTCADGPRPLTCALAERTPNSSTATRSWWDSNADRRPGGRGRRLGRKRAAGGWRAPACTRRLDLGIHGGCMFRFHQVKMPWNRPLTDVAVTPGDDARASSLRASGGRGCKRRGQAERSYSWRGSLPAAAARRLLSTLQRACGAGANPALRHVSACVLCRGAAANGAERASRRTWLRVSRAGCAWRSGHGSTKLNSM